MKYPLLEITVLIDLLLVKENLPKNRQGLISLLEKVEDLLEDESKRSDEQYLYKLNNNIARDFRLKKTSISVKETFITCCLRHLEYDNFEEFQKELDRVKAAIGNRHKGKNSLQLLLHASVKEEVKERMEASLYKEQVLKAEIIELESFQVLNQQRDEEASSVLGIVLISSAFYLQEEEELKEWLYQNGKASFIPLWWLEEGTIPNTYKKFIDEESLLEEPYDFKVLLQVLQSPFWNVQPLSPTQPLFEKVKGLFDNLYEQIDKKNSWLLGILGILVLGPLLFVSLNRCPTYPQVFFLRPSLALGVSGLFASLASNWKLRSMDLKFPLSFLVFFILYFINPVSIVKGEACSMYSSVRGRVLMGERPLQKAVITLPRHREQAISNGKGEFLIQWRNGGQEEDSIYFQITHTGVDTSFYATITEDPLEIILRDTLTPISRKILDALIKERVHQFELEQEGRFLQWHLKDSVALQTVIGAFRSFEAHQANYRNEFYFQGLGKELEFRKRLLAVGIEEANSILPYDRHLLESSSLYLLEQAPFPEYRLYYLVLNKRPLNYSLLKLQQLAADHYRASISFEENVRAIRVLLDCSKKSNGYKRRQMEVYGFLPVEDYELRFKQGKWQIL